MLDQDLAWLSDLVSTDEIVAMMERIEAGHPFPEAADDPLLSPETSKLTEPEAKRLWGESHKIRKILPRLRCLAPVTPSCPKKPIGSHSIQKAGPLSYLSDHSGHVLSLQRSPNPAERPGAQMIKMGVREASTFPELCPQHDATLFQPIDQPLVQPTPEQLFLLSYRSVLREQYIGRWSERMFSKSLSLAIKARMPRSYIVFMLAHLRGLMPEFAGRPIASVFMCAVDHVGGTHQCANELSSDDRVRT